MKFVFDVDGTLTPSRSPINKEFEEWFYNFTNRHKVYLVTGSDYEKTIEQLGERICESVDTVYNCSGSSVWKQGKNVYNNDWHLPMTERSFLLQCLSKSKFVLRTGLHIEERKGMINFSVVGRNATLGERKLYVKWDTEQKERNRIASEFNSMFPNLVATVGGDTGIDISPRGSDKSQILRDFDKEEIVFFGDAVYEGGNDYPLAKAILDNCIGRCYTVNSWNRTWDILKDYD